MYMQSNFVPAFIWNFGYGVCSFLLEVQVEL